MSASAIVTTAAVTVILALLAGMLTWMVNGRSEATRIAEAQIAQLEHRSFTAAAAIDGLRSAVGETRGALRNGEPFTAVTDCPKCGAVDVHWLDEPKRVTAEQWAEHKAAVAEYDPSKVEIVGWSGEVVQTARLASPPQPPRNEKWPVARVCTACGFRWGQS